MDTLQSVFHSVWQCFSEHGIESAQLEARLLTAFVTGKTPAQFLRDRSELLSPKAKQQLQMLTMRRLSGEPLAYLTGSTSFYGLVITVCPGVLIPRIDTEVLIDCVLQDLSEKLDREWAILDLCSGSGCIGCALADNLPHSHVTLADISHTALTVSRTNIERNGLTDRVFCRFADAQSAPELDWEPIDLLVCNPPYIPTADLYTLDHSVRDYEPILALDGGADGLDFYRAVLEHWVPLLVPGGRLYFEVGIHQAQDVFDLLPQYNIEPLRTVHDTLNIPRVVIGIRT